MSEITESVAAPKASAPDGQQCLRGSKCRSTTARTNLLYANFCRVTGTPEELIIDFGLNPQPFGVPTEPIAINQRIVTNFFTAKRLWHALSMTLQRHEATFGVLETDVQKRVSPAARVGEPISPFYLVLTSMIGSNGSGRVSTHSQARRISFSVGVSFTVRWLSASSSGIRAWQARDHCPASKSARADS